MLIQSLFAVLLPLLAANVSNVLMILEGSVIFMLPANGIVAFDAFGLLLLDDVVILGAATTPDASVADVLLNNELADKLRFNVFIEFDGLLICDELDTSLSAVSSPLK